MEAGRMSDIIMLLFALLFIVAGWMVTNAATTYIDKYSNVCAEAKSKQIKLENCI